MCWEEYYGPTQTTGRHPSCDTKSSMANVKVAVRARPLLPRSVRHKLHLLQEYIYTYVYLVLILLSHLIEDCMDYEKVIIYLYEILYAQSLNFISLL